jgi:hypothetical protein
LTPVRGLVFVEEIMVRVVLTYSVSPPMVLAVSRIVLIIATIPTALCTLSCAGRGFGREVSVIASRAAAANWVGAG